MATLTETMYRTQTPLGEPMQARDLDFLRLSVRRYMAAQGLSESEYAGWFNPPVVTVQNTYDGQRMVASVTTAEPVALWGGEVRF